MTEQELNQRAEQALMFHKKGYNCAQAVACAFSDLTDVDETALLSGLTRSTGRLDKPDSKADSYKVSKACLNDFKEQNGSVTCRDLKGIDTKKVLRSCDGCIEDAARIIGRQLF